MLLSRFGPDAYDLNVRGDLAQVQLDKITILGPQVEINQQTNVAEVSGMGVLKMPSTRDFNGNQLKKPSDLTIRWQDHMLFKGAVKDVIFQGNVQANQATGNLLCQALHATLDRPVSFKQTTKGNPNAHIDRLVCERDVDLEDNPQEDGKVVGFQRLLTPAVFMDNAEGHVDADGPGMVHILKYGSEDDDPLAAPNAPGKQKQSAKATKKDAKDQQLTLTQVQYVGRLSANNKKRLAIFYTNVEVIHGPVDRKALVDHRLLNVNRDALPPGFMYLHCDRLNIYTREPAAPNGKRSQDMRAVGQVVVRAREFWGTAAEATYDEEKELVVLHGNDGIAKLYRIAAPGLPPATVTGKTIKYWRRTNDYEVDGSGESRLGQ